MKIQFKAAFIIACFGLVLVAVFAWAADLMSHRIVIGRELSSLQKISDEIAEHIGSHLIEKTSIALTLSSSPLIKDSLLQSNSKFAILPEEERKKQIEALNKRWQETTNVNDPFIQAYLTNPVAQHLKNQQEIFPGMYGEIFLTNIYGAMISSTGKLTTLAHAHKYWWQACYADGQGKIFLDDRGFDISVEGYVLGVVVPVRKGNEIIGILKCNVNILSPLTDVIQEFSKRSPAQMKIVRTGGLIVSEQGVVPLSKEVSSEISIKLQSRSSGNYITNEQEKKLVAYSPILQTLGSEKYSFGGKYQSIDQIKGNTGEAWHIVISLAKDTAIEIAHETTRLIVLVGVIFAVLISLIAFVLGRFIALPIINIANTSKEIGQGNLEAKVSVSSNDEIGALARSINQMAENLHKTMTSKTNLEEEVRLRKIEEQKKEELISELKQALQEIKTLRGIIPICSKCKKIRDGEGYWQQVEHYVAEHTDATFSHGMCRKCSDELYGGQDWYEEAIKDEEIPED